MAENIFCVGEHWKEMEDEEVTKKKETSTAIRKQEELWNEDMRDWTWEKKKKCMFGFYWT